MHSRRYYKNRKDRRDRVLKKLANARAAKAKKKEENPPEQEPKMEKYYPLEIGVRDKLTRETAWIDLRSVRDASKRLSVVLRYCSHHMGF